MNKNGSGNFRIYTNVARQVSERQPQTEPAKRVVLIVDTPNVTRSVVDAYGSGYVPDWRALYNIGTLVGELVRALALVNPGCPAWMTSKLHKLGYKVWDSRAADVDDAIVAWAVRLRQQADMLVLASGDGGYIPLFGLLHEVGIKTILCAVELRCHPHLRAITDNFVSVPVLRSPFVQSGRMHSSTKQVTERFPLNGTTPIYMTVEGGNPCARKH